MHVIVIPVKYQPEMFFSHVEAKRGQQILVESLALNVRGAGQLSRYHKCPNCWNQVCLGVQDD